MALGSGDTFPRSGTGSNNFFDKADNLSIISPFRIYFERYLGASTKHQIKAYPLRECESF